MFNAVDSNLCFVELTSSMNRYGWNCRTQIHRVEHAKKLNVCFVLQFNCQVLTLHHQHLCEPSERDDTGKTNNNANANVAHPVLDIDMEENSEEEYESDTEDEDMQETEDETEDEE